ncbi:MAG: hypothetical protein ABR899_09885 [Candidatus Krumholzibacteriaceae bacterium]|jgi:predicted Na+-dependent transporter
MIATTIVVALLLGGLALSRAPFMRGLKTKRFMSFVYAAAAVYFAVLAYEAVEGHTRVWPHVVLGVIFLAGAIDSARASGVPGRS